MTQKQRMSMSKLTWPIFLETLLRMLFMNVDIFMLSNYSDKAVAAVGLVNQVVFFVIISLMMVSSGASVLISQYLGAEDRKGCQKIVHGSISLIAIAGVVIGLILLGITKPVLKLYDLEPKVFGYAWDYLSIFSIFIVAFAVNIGFSTVLRSFGYSREPMLINLFGNVLNVIGNYIALFAPFGLPNYGVEGVAYSTAISQFIASLVMFAIMIKKPDINFVFKELFSVSRTTVFKILKIGIPTAGESLSYNLAHIVILFAISKMGTASLSAYSYGMSIMRMIFVAALSIGQASSILVGYLVGAGKNDIAFHKVVFNFKISLAISVTLAAITALFRYQIAEAFTQDPETIRLTASLLLWSMVLEPARAFNLVFIHGMKGAGDIQFPVKIGIISMWGVAVLCSYLLGTVAGIGILGVWIAFSMDEWTRGLIMMRRWRSRAWEKYIIASPKEAQAPVK